jgi:hypothetical protein
VVSFDGGNWQAAAYVQVVTFVGTRCGVTGMRGTGSRLAASATGRVGACAAAALLVTACASGAGSSAGGAGWQTGRTAAGVAGDSAPPPAGSASAANSMPYDLYTHCGIDEARINGRFYEAVKPLSDGNSNPPPGWGNPYQHGTMTLASPSEAVFTDSAGHRVVFKVRAGATGFKHVCG